MDFGVESKKTVVWHRVYTQIVLHIAVVEIKVFRFVGK